MRSPPRSRLEEARSRAGRRGHPRGRASRRRGHPGGRSSKRRAHNPGLLPLSDEVAPLLGRGERSRCGGLGGLMTALGRAMPAPMTALWRAMTAHDCPCEVTNAHDRRCEAMRSHERTQKIVAAHRRSSTFRFSANRIPSSGSDRVNVVGGLFAVGVSPRILIHRCGKSRMT